MPDFLQDLVGLVLPSTASYALLHAFSEAVVIPLLDKRRVQALSPGDRIDLGEKLSSTVHALRISLGAAFLIFRDQAFARNVFYPYPDSARQLLAEYAGYTLYDIGVMACKPHEALSMWAHHIIGASGTLAMLHYGQGAYFPIAFLMTEIAVPIVNIHWAFERLGNRTSPRGKRIRLALLFSRAVAYVVFRLAVAPFVLWYGLKHQDINFAATKSTIPIEELATTGLIPTGQQFMDFVQKMIRLPSVVWIASSFNMMALSVLNVIWTRAVWRSFWREWQRQQMNKYS